MNQTNDAVLVHGKMNRKSASSIENTPPIISVSSPVYVLLIVKASNTLTKPDIRIQAASIYVSIDSCIAGSQSITKPRIKDTAPYSSSKNEPERKPRLTRPSMKENRPFTIKSNANITAKLPVEKVGNIIIAISTPINSIISTVLNSPVFLIIIFLNFKLNT